MSGLLGVDASMTETFARWAGSMMGANTAQAIKDDAAQQKRFQELARDAKDMEAYLLECMEERRKSPQKDLITYLIQAAEGNDHLTERRGPRVVVFCGGEASSVPGSAWTELPERLRLSLRNQRGRSNQSVFRQPSKVTQERQSLSGSSRPRQSLGRRRFEPGTEEV